MLVKPSNIDNPDNIYLPTTSLSRQHPSPNNIPRVQTIVQKQENCTGPE
jgi:hypothetical protein